MFFALGPLAWVDLSTGDLPVKLLGLVSGGVPRFTPSRQSHAVMFFGHFQCFFFNLGSFFPKVRLTFAPMKLGSKYTKNIEDKLYCHMGLTIFFIS